MKKITLYLAVIVLAGASFVSYWAYVRYFQKPASKLLTYQVVRGDLKDLLHARGEVAADREYDLAFNSFGTVASVPVSEGQVVKEGDLLMRLDTTSLELEMKRQFAVQLQAKAAVNSANSQLIQATAARDAVAARLDELKRGTRPEELQVSQAKVDSAAANLSEANKTLMNAVKDAYTKSDDAIRNIADQTLLNPRSSTVQIGFVLPDSNLQRTIELARPEMESLLVSWKASLNALTTTNLTGAVAQAEANLDSVKTFMDELALALNGAIASPSVSQATLATWQTNVSLGRTNVSAAVANLRDGEASQQNATTALSVAKDELSVLQAGTPEEQIAAQTALVREADAAIASAQAGVSQAQAVLAADNAQIDIIRDQITKSSIFAPGPAKVTKLWLKANEQYQQSLQGMPAISLVTIGIKIQSDISELDIPKVNEGNGNPVTIIFDAYPDRTYTGKVESVEPKEIIKDTDTYYRVNITLDSPTDDLRRGMSADLTILSAEKTNVLKIPAFAVTERDRKTYVNVLQNGMSVETEIQTGISDGDYTEVQQGLTEGETIVVSSG